MEFEQETRHYRQEEWARNSEGLQAAIEIKKSLVALSWASPRWAISLRLQYIDDDDGEHHLKVVQVLVTMQHFTQIFGIFNVPRQLHVLFLLTGME